MLQVSVRRWRLALRMVRRSLLHRATPARKRRRIKDTGRTGSGTMVDEVAEEANNSKPSSDARQVVKAVDHTAMQLFDGHYSLNCSQFTQLQCY